jgi:hypothetical protein
MRRSFVALAMLLCVNCHAQIKFEKGYFINNAGSTTICLLENADWKNNPTTFDYRISETSETLQGSLQDVQEFGISNSVKYKRFAVKIDRSSNKTEKLSNKRAPEFMEETLFLKVLVEGKVSLYQFSGDGLSRFFYSTDGVEVTPLVYKEYRTKDVRAINDSYKQQLWNELKCAALTEKDARETTYTTASLTKYFKQYNSCVQSPVKLFGENDDKVTFNLSLRPGVVFSSLSVSKELSGNNMDFGNNTSFRFGLETELVLPFKKNSWSIVIEPTYQQYKSGTLEGPYPGFIEPSIEYSSIEIPFGVRRYFFLSEKATMFMNAQFMYDIPLKSSVDITTGADLEMKTSGSFTAGIGFRVKERFSIESRYQFNRQLFNGFTFMDTRFHGIAIIVGYTF